MDIWALGCVFYEMITLNPLFPGDNELDQLLKIHDVLGSPSARLLSKFLHENKYIFPKRSSVPIYNIVPLLSDGGVDILNKTLSYHPDTRISARKLVDHGYFENCRTNRKFSRSISIQNITKNTYHNKLSNSSLANSDSTVPTCRTDFSSNSLRKISNLSVQKKVADERVRTMKNHELERTWGMNEGKKKEDMIKKLRRIKI